MSLLLQKNSPKINFMEKKYLFSDYKNYQDYYPIVIVPEKIIGNLELKIDDSMILNYLGLSKLPTLTEYLIPKEGYGARVYKLKPIKIDEIFNIDNLKSLNYLEYCDFYLENKLIQKKPKPYLIQEKLEHDFKSWFILIFSIICAIIIALFMNIIFALFAFFLIIIVFSYGEIQLKKKIYTRIYLDENEYNEKLKKFALLLKNEVSEINKKKSKEIKLKNDILNKNRNSISEKIFRSCLKSEIEIKLNNLNENRGKTELFFLEKLYDFFGNQIKIDASPNVGSNPFQPDYILICNITGLHINIEIDEPYSAKNGIPIHHERSNDSKRNDFFSEINWIVIRFSEQQIIQETNACCNLISNVINSIINKNNSYSHNVTLQKKWSYEEAQIMKNKNIRNSYLPQDMKVNITYKKNNELDNFLEELPF
jgi:hypothetical protein